MSETGESNPWSKDPNENLAAAAERKAAAEERRTKERENAEAQKAAAMRAAEQDAAAKSSSVLRVLIGVAALVLVGLLVVGAMGSSGNSAETATSDVEETDAEEDSAAADFVPESTDEVITEDDSDDTSSETPVNAEADAAEAEEVDAEEESAPDSLAFEGADEAVTEDDSTDPDQSAAVEAEPDTAEEEEEVADEAVEELPPLSDLPERGAVFRPPTLFLEGPVPTQEIADQFYAAAAAVVGPDNIVNNYVVRPDAPLDIDGNVTVEQAVIFQTGSAVIAQDFYPTLELAVAVMGLNPQATLVIEGHTDNVGNDASNLALSQARAEAVATYLVGRDVAADRLEAVGLGETAPVADNATAEGRLQNRRIEFEIIDLLTPPS